MVRNITFYEFLRRYFSSAFKTHITDSTSGYYVLYLTEVSWYASKIVHQADRCVIAV